MEFISNESYGSTVSYLLFLRGISELNATLTPSDNKDAKQSDKGPLLTGEDKKFPHAL